MAIISSVENRQPYLFGAPSTGNSTASAVESQSIFADGSADGVTGEACGDEVVTESTGSTAPGCTDGEDDGKIGFFDAIGSAISGAFKGLVNGIKGCFTDENGNFSIWNTLKTVATIGACFIPGIGPFIAGGLCVMGVANGIGTIANGIGAAANAKTDAEAKAAFEEIGSGTLTTGMSVAGLRGSVHAIAKSVGGAEGAVAESAASGATKGFFKGLKSDISTITKSNGGSGIIKSTFHNLSESAGFAEGGFYRTAYRTGVKSALENGAKSGSISARAAGFKNAVGEGIKGTGHNIGAAVKSFTNKEMNFSDEELNALKENEKISNAFDEAGINTETATSADIKQLIEDGKISQSDITNVQVNGKNIELKGRNAKAAKQAENTYKKNNTTAVKEGTLKKLETGKELTAKQAEQINNSNILDTEVKAGDILKEGEINRLKNTSTRITEANNAKITKQDIRQINRETGLKLDRNVTEFTREQIDTATQKGLNNELLQKMQQNKSYGAQKSFRTLRESYGQGRTSGEFFTYDGATSGTGALTPSQAVKVIAADAVNNGNESVKADASETSFRAKLKPYVY